METIIKYMLKNIWEKKLRTILILFSIIISSALFFASSAISNTISKMYIEKMKADYGTADIIIEADSKSPSWLFSTYAAEKYNSELDYVVGICDDWGLYKTKSNQSSKVRLLGSGYEGLQRFNPVVLYQEENLLPFEGKKIILSRVTAEKYDLKAGDSMDIKIDGVKRKFNICGIAEATGPFINEGFNIKAVIPKDTLTSFFYARGKSSQIYIRLKDPTKTNLMVEKLSEDYRGYIVRRPINDMEIEKHVSDISTPFMLMTILVALMSVFIIYSSFNVIALERLPAIGTFRSIGATHRTTNIIMLLESAIYGILGGVLGVGLGYIILSVMTQLSKPAWIKSTEAVPKFTVMQMIGAFIFAICLCFFSSLIPIIKVSRIPIKDIILNTINKKKVKKPWKFVLGIIFLVIGLVGPPITPKSISLVSDTICIIFVIFSIILLIPFLTSIFVGIIEKISFLGNIVILAAKNLRDNNNISNNISLLAIGISSLLMINTLSYSVADTITNFYSSSQFDIMMYKYRADRRFENLLHSVEGVSDTYGMFEASNIEVVGRKEKIRTLHGIDQNLYFEYWNFPIEGNRQELLSKLYSGRYILLTDILVNKLNVKIGDTLTLKLNGKSRPYVVIGAFNSLFRSGNIALISERFFKLDTDICHYSNIYVKTNKNPYDVQKQINSDFARRHIWTMTMDEMQRNDQQKYVQMFIILRGFSFLALFIGIIGVVNNLIISFIQRKRHLAVLGSVGMSKEQAVKMLILEAVIGGLIGGVTGVATGMLMLFIVKYVMESTNTMLLVHYSLPIMLISMLSGIVIMLISSVVPILKTSKLNLIEAIKYE